MIIYRFERNGIGPYMNRSRAYRITKDRMKKARSVKKYTKKLEQSYNRTQEHIDNYYEVHKDNQYMYGCTSKEKLRMYFYGDFKILFKEGFRIKRYNVPDHEVRDLGIEVAFPVRYHKLQNKRKIDKVLQIK